MASDQEIIAQVADTLMVPESKLSTTSVAKDLVEWDSMGTMNILLMLDDEYGVKLPPGETDALQSMAGIIGLVKKTQQNT